VRRPAREVAPLTKPRRRILWRKITTYTAVYVAPKTRDKIVVHSLTQPPKFRTFHAAQGMRKYKLKKCIVSNRKVIIMAKAAKTKNTKGKKSQKDEEEILDSELEDLEDVEDLDDLEDDDEDEDEESDDGEDEDEDDEEEDEDEEEEEEAPKKSKKGKAKASRSRTTDGKVGTSELAAAAGTDARGLRMVLRKMNIQKDPETSRYEWDSLKDPEAQKIIKAVKKGAVKDAQKESLDKLKANKSKPAEKTKSGKKGKKKSKS
jgi:ABC-type Zn2+ transport system substrate-binding protein/surface adhesin